MLGIDDSKYFKRQKKRKKVDELYSSNQSKKYLIQLYDSASDILNLSDLLGEEADTLKKGTTEKADTSDKNIVGDDFVIVHL